MRLRRALVCGVSPPPFLYLGAFLFLVFLILFGFCILNMDFGTRPFSTFLLLSLFIAHAQGLWHPALFFFEPFHSPCSGTSAQGPFLLWFFNFLPLSGLFCKTVCLDCLVVLKPVCFSVCHSFILLPFLCLGTV